MRSIENAKRQRIAFLFLLPYLLTVLWFTVLKRPLGEYQAQLDLFWSYREWLAGGKKIGWEILGNIAMFVPLGFFVTGIFGGRRGPVLVLAAALVCSLGIELAQLLLMRGFFEWDDLLGNCLGAMLGWALFRLLAGRLDERRFSAAFLSLGFLFMAGCLGVLLFGDRDDPDGDSSSKVYCLQLNDASLEGTALRLDGFAFLYDRPTAEPVLVLRSTATGRRTKLALEYGLASPDVNAYFLCDRDYTHAGFTAKGEADPSQEYEVMIRWPRSILMSTGIYVKGGELRDVPEKDTSAPTLSELFVTEGRLRASRPDFHCWVYQFDGALYWITDEGFSFEESGKTYIQYQLWTTQTEKLPENRLANGHLWDNIGGYFEDYELEGDFAPYRVMRRELPTEYAQTSVLTGFYKNGEWIWKAYFRPVYPF